MLVLDGTTPVLRAVSVEGDPASEELGSGSVLPFGLTHVIL